MLNKGYCIVLYCILWHKAIGYYSIPPPPHLDGKPINCRVTSSNMFRAARYTHLHMKTKVKRGYKLSGANYPV